MSHLVKAPCFIYIGVPFPEEAPGTDSPISKYYNGLTTRRPICIGLDISWFICNISHCSI